MTALRILWSRAVDFFLRRRREQRLAEEVRAHLDLLTDDTLHVAWRPVTPGSPLAKASAASIR